MSTLQCVRLIIDDKIVKVNTEITFKELYTLAEIKDEEDVSLKKILIRENGKIITISDEKIKDNFCDKDELFIKRKYSDVQVAAHRKYFEEIGKGKNVHILDNQAQTDEMCLHAVSGFGRFLKYVQNQTKEICDAAVKNDSDASCFIRKNFKNKYSQEQLAANDRFFSSYPIFSNLGYQLTSLTIDGKTIKVNRETTTFKEIYSLSGCLDENGDINNVLILENGKTIAFNNTKLKNTDLCNKDIIRKKYNAAQVAAHKKYFDAVKNGKRRRLPKKDVQTDEMRAYAERYKTLLSKYAKFQTKEFCDTDEETDYYSLNSVSDENEEKSPKDSTSILKNLDQQTDEICFAVLKKNPFELKYVKNQTSDLCFLAAVKNLDTKCFIRDDRIKKSVEDYLKNKTFS